MHNRIDKQIHAFTCDDGRSASCEGEVELEGHFEEAVTELRNLGWQTYYNKGAWEHVCPKCKALKKETAWNKFKERAQDV